MSAGRCRHLSSAPVCIRHRSHGPLSGIACSEREVMPGKSDSVPTAGKSGSVFGAERQQIILGTINRGDTVSVGEFADRFGVSQETVRRDIRSLEEAGYLRRVHGGAAPMTTFDLTARRPVVERLQVDRNAKQNAARAAMALFQDDMHVYLGTSSTMRLVAEALVRSGIGLTVTTNMLDIAALLAGAKRCTVNMLGGVVNPDTNSVGGYETLKSLEGRLFDLCVLGCSAVSSVKGVLGPTKAHEVLVNTLAAQSQHTAFVTDSTKFGRRDGYVVLPLDRVDYIATDLPPPDAFTEAFTDAGIRILLPC
ncbi:DeoR/GlpR family DNA-binding transcription regulator [Chelatococcus asaccharovorans]|uniref:DeoR/GlpR family DNA-binding transcription regulator n=1 Tax=Chelatococcus asaccharovorans TaxID=28210 RepID=UPI002264772A|nr:DeoR/GlpR family DNA-binding transcription regulator [Chelatococcus asaccharovorans]